MSKENNYISPFSNPGFVNIEWLLTQQTTSELLLNHLDVLHLLRLSSVSKAISAAAKEFKPPIHIILIRLYPHRRVLNTILSKFNHYLTMTAPLDFTLLDWKEVFQKTIDAFFHLYSGIHILNRTNDWNDDRFRNRNILEKLFLVLF